MAKPGPIQGRIYKGIGGLYYVKTPSAVLECQPRGIFRRQGVAPLVGDWVTVEPGQEGRGQIVEIHPRRNWFVRPRVANLDQLVFVVSSCDPSPNLSVLDRLIAIGEYKKVEMLLVVTKTDLCQAHELEEIYRGAGFTVVSVCGGEEEGVRRVYDALAGKMSVFTGNSGVGKSTLLNRIDPRFTIPTGDISKKLGRGRHTTRHVELYELENGGIVADTPGFSAIEVEQFERIRKEELEGCFREFAPYLGLCRFTGCSHTKEKGCAVLEALREGTIAPSRHESYVQMYEQARQIKDWELPGNDSQQSGKRGTNR